MSIIEPGPGLLAAASPRAQHCYIDQLARGPVVDLHTAQKLLPNDRILEQSNLIRKHRYHGIMGYGGP